MREVATFIRNFSSYVNCRRAIYGGTSTVQGISFVGYTGLWVEDFACGTYKPYALYDSITTLARLGCDRSCMDLIGLVLPLALGQLF